MPRAPRKECSAAFPLLLLAAVIILSSSSTHGADNGFAPSFTGEPAWGDGTRCVPIPTSPDTALAFRFHNPKALEIERVFLPITSRGGRARGKIHVELRADAEGIPGSQVLGSADIAPPGAGRDWLDVDLGGASLLNGDVYHLVVHSVGGRSQSRLCLLWHRDGTPPAKHPWTALKLANGTWWHTPVSAGWLEPSFVLRYVGGDTWGQPYWSTRADHVIFAHHRMQAVIVPAGDVRLTSVSVRLQGGKEPAPLQYRLLDPHGAVVSEGQLYPDGVPGPWPTGFGLPLAPAVPLAGGQTHIFIIESPFARSAKEGYRHRSLLTDFRDASGLPMPLEAARRRGRRGKHTPSLAESLFFTIDPGCGNGVVDQEFERCDGPDDGTCPGQCRSDCSCGLKQGEENIAPRAAVTASSENVDTGSVSTSAVDGVIDGVPGDATHEWVASGESNGAWLRLEWPSPVTVDRVILHDRPSRFDNLLAASLQVDGESIPVGELAPDGSGTMIALGRRTILTLTLFLTAVQGGAGLSEIEVLAASQEPPNPPGPPGGPPNPPGPPGPPAPVGTFYLSPDGKDSNSGSTPERPWRTFARAFNPAKPLRPGDVLVLLDGTYTPSTTGLPQIDCSSSGNARSGTENSRIVMRAANERRAHLKSDGSREALSMSNCQNWTLSGIYASNTDNSSAKSSAGHVLQFGKNTNLRLERLLAVRPNRTCPNETLPYCNSHAIELSECKNVVIEESEAYDFHRHGFSVFRSRDVVVRRSYANSRGNTETTAQATGLILYGSSRSIVENTIAEDTGGINIAGTGSFDGGPGGYDNLIVGTITLRNWYGSTVRARRFGDNVYPLGNNVIRDSVYALTTEVGLFARGAANTLLENVTFFGTQGKFALGVDEDLSEGAPCSANSQGTCSFTARNVLFLDGKGPAYFVKSEVVRPWLIESSNSFGNAGGNYPASDAPDDDSGNVRASRSVEPSGMGLAEGKCLLWPPDGSNMKGAGKNGADVGAKILYRTEHGQPTTIPLWDPATGRFPCGAVVSGVNDVPGNSCFDVHERLNVNRNGCKFPANYP